jgi:hypothetical protein
MTRHRWLRRFPLRLPSGSSPSAACALQAAGTWVQLLSRPRAVAPTGGTYDGNIGVARRHRQNRGGGEGCGYAASLGQRKRVAHIPTADAEAARSGVILERQRQARLHLKSKPPWSLRCTPKHNPRCRLTLESGTRIILRTMWHSDWDWRVGRSRFRCRL